MGKFAAGFSLGCLRAGRRSSSSEPRIGDAARGRFFEVLLSAGGEEASPLET